MEVDVVTAPFSHREQLQINRIKENLRLRGFSSLVKTIAADHKLSVDVVLSRRRPKSVMVARKTLYRSLRAHALSYPEIGALLERDHTTIIVGCHYNLPEVPDLMPSIIREVA